MQAQALAPLPTADSADSADSAADLPPGLEPVQPRNVTRSSLRYARHRATGDLWSQRPGRDWQLLVKAGQWHDPLPAIVATGPARGISTFQQQKLVDLFADLNPDADVSAGLDALARHAFQRPLANLAYDEARQLTADLLRAKRDAQAEAHPATPAADPPLAQAGEAPDCTFSFAVEGIALSGYRGTLTVHGPTLRDVAAKLRQLRAYGIQPTEGSDFTPPTELPDGRAICHKHHVAMSSRDKQGDRWWSHRVTAADGTELYCRGYPDPKLSPGYDH